MDVGVVKVAEDEDFERLRRLLDNHEGWKLEYEKQMTKVWTKSACDTNFKMIKIDSVFDDVSPDIMYDVLHDPEYRKVWDQHMIESHDIGWLNPNNDVGYYASKRNLIFYFVCNSILCPANVCVFFIVSCPSPLQNRDFVLQRSWLDTGQEKFILNHSVAHRDYPPRKGFVRAISFLTGFLVRAVASNGCQLGYVSQSDPQGKLPHWIVNKVTQIFAPKVSFISCLTVLYMVVKYNFATNCFFIVDGEETFVSFKKLSRMEK